MNNCILIHYGEISLKGKNQPYFRKQLLRNIRLSLKSIDIDWPIRQFRGYLMLTVKETNRISQAVERLLRVLGISWYAPAYSFECSGFDSDSTESIINKIETKLCVLAKKNYSIEATFRVDVRRSDKRFPGTSIELERRFGAAIIKKTHWQKLNIKETDQIFNVEIQNNEVFIHSDKIKGAGGLPVNTAQNVLVLLSGGIDSPVAAYLAARRGCHIDFLHFTASHVQPDEIVESKIGLLAKKLSEYTLKSKLYVLPSTYFDIAIAGKPADYQLILFRRFMARAAENLSGKISAHALVTGDNLSQVASQTLTNIASTTRAIEIPVLQPLITYEKEEIINRAIQIDTYETSIQPYKDCCSLFQRNPRTVSDHSELSKLETNIFSDYDKMITQTLDDIFWIDCKYGKIH